VALVASSTRTTVCVQELFLRQLKAAQGSQIAEFALALPLLMVFLIGITDFGAAFTLNKN
jgi:Flp pilus assembly protein TadG